MTEPEPVTWKELINLAAAPEFADLARATIALLEALAEQRTSRGQVAELLVGRKYLPLVEQLEDIVRNQRMRFKMSKERLGALRHTLWLLESLDLGGFVREARSPGSIAKEISELLTDYMVRYSEDAQQVEGAGHSKPACLRCGSSQVERQRTTAIQPHYFEYICSKCGKTGGGFEGDAEDLMDGKYKVWMTQGQGCGEKPE